MKFSLAQINPRIGDTAHNLALILEAIQDARAKGAGAVVFPELSTIGYPPRDLMDYPETVDRNLRSVEAIRLASTGILVIVGFAERNPSEFGKPFFNSAAVFYDGQEITRYRKRLLPYYGIFEDERYFEAGTSSGLFEFQGKTYGLAICEDIWNAPGFIERRHWVDPLKDMEGRSLSGLICLSASPFQLGKPELRMALLQQISERLKCPVYYCNQTGGNDEVLFDGGSACVKGNKASVASFFQEALWFDGTSSAAWPKSESEWLVRALSMGIRDYLSKTKSQRVVLGLSGGIDSAVVASLAVRALGKENVEGIALPSEFTSAESCLDAAALAKNLGIHFREFSIVGIYEAIRASLSTLQPQSLTLENIQPRIRMTILMAIANETRALLLNTSNKSELSTGYATLYGDSAGAIAVLGDLTKHQVYGIAKWLNQEKETIPQRTIDRPPTAELKAGQVDQDTLPPYAELDELVVESIEKATGPTEWKRKFPGAADKFAHLHRISEFKRRQFPPILRVTSRAIGAGRRIPVAAQHYADN